MIRIILFSDFFNSFYTFIVILNTILLSITYYGMSDELEFLLDEISGQFTKLFIAEFVLKLLGIGPIKYLEDRMNIFDCSIVSISLFEIIYSSVYYS